MPREKPSAPVRKPSDVIGPVHLLSRDQVLDAYADLYRECVDAAAPVDVVLADLLRRVGAQATQEK